MNTSQRSEIWWSLGGQAKGTERGGQCSRRSDTPPAGPLKGTVVWLAAALAHQHVLLLASS